MTDTAVTAVEGKNIVYLFRLYADRATNGATTLAFQTENDHSMKADSDSTATKDGNIVTMKPVAEEVTASAVLSTKTDLINKFKNAIRTGALVELWEVNLSDVVKAATNTTPGQYNGEYMQGKLSEMTLKAQADSSATYDMTFEINGTGKPGAVTVSQENQEAIDYVFNDTSAAGGN